MRVILMIAAALWLTLAATVARTEADGAQLPPAPDLPNWQGMTPRSEDYGAASKRSVYLRAADGTRLAADVYLPEGLPASVKLPTVLYQTRYYRSGSLKDDPIASCKAIRPAYSFFARRSYAVVVVDVRGTGASFGSHLNEYSEAEVRDGTAIADWIVAQPWSNGGIGATGASYVGTTAELFVLNRHRAIKAIAPVSSGWDFYAEVLFPGGVPNRFLNDSWGHANAALDQGKTVLAPAASIRALAGPCRVDEDADGSLLAAAQKEHADNFNISVALQVARFRDDPLGTADRWPAVYPFSREIDASAVPSLYLVGWADAGYALAALNRLRNSRAATQHVIIGASNHGMQTFAAPGVEVAMRSQFDPAAATLRFFDHYVAGRDNGVDREPRIRWFTTGANEWRSANAWAQPARRESFCFAENGELRQHSCGRKTSFNAIPADAATGPATRWNTTLGGGAVIYPDRRTADEQMVSFTSEPLTAAHDVMGSPTVTLLLRNNAKDADIFVYLEEVLATGQARYVTEGMLRASHGQRGAAPYGSLLAAHSDLRRDAKFDTAGKTLKLKIGMLPVAHRFAAGSRLRVAVAGSDTEHFSSPPLNGQQWLIFVGKRASLLRVPVTDPAKWPNLNSKTPAGPGP